MYNELTHAMNVDKIWVYKIKFGFTKFSVYRTVICLIHIQMHGQKVRVGRGVDSCICLLAT